ncbi:MAG: hypothetical protein HQM09_15265 [Candidatus Riflebacteria bacterium]|nr:hypothetical protein [Candidatus Riflebacteria bacterium]
MKYVVFNTKSEADALIANFESCDHAPEWRYGDAKPMKNGKWAVLITDTFLCCVPESCSVVTLTSDDFPPAPHP